MHHPAGSLKSSRIGEIVDSRGDEKKSVHRFACQGFTLRLSDGSSIPVETAHFTAARHGFAPGRLLGRLRGDYLISIDGGLVRAFPFRDQSAPDDPLDRAP